MPDERITFEQHRAWLESRPHVSYCPCSTCKPDADRKVDPLEARLASTCPGCGEKSLDATGRCTVCGAEKNDPRWREFNVEPPT